MHQHTMEAYECLIRSLKKKIEAGAEELQEEEYLWIKKEDMIFNFLMSRLGYKESYGLAKALDEFHKKETGSVYGHVECFEERYEHLAPKEQQT